MLIIDAFAFCQNGEQRSGKLPLSKLSRLGKECVSQDGEVEWTLIGSISERVNGYPALHLTMSATVQLLCQRCLTSYPFQIKSNASILVVKDERAADQLEAFLQDDDLEVIVGSKTFDVMALVEDEALLALPLAPKHETCPADVKTGAKKQSANAQLADAGQQEKESPFAVLKKLK